MRTGFEQDVVVAVEEIDETACVQRHRSQTRGGEVSLSTRHLEQVDAGERVGDRHMRRIRQRRARQRIAELRGRIRLVLDDLAQVAVGVVCGSYAVGDRGAVENVEGAATAT